MIIAALAEGGEGAEAVDVFVLDFLLQHPSLLRTSRLELPPDALPTTVEAESSEEALLRWKRSVGSRVLAPMVGRLIARGLVRRRRDGRLELVSRGEEVAEQLRKSTGGVERKRLPRLATQVAANPQSVRQSLLAALGGGSD